jgi:uncharacterized protein (DUF2252 family)
MMECDGAPRNPIEDSAAHARCYRKHPDLQPRPRSERLTMKLAIAADPFAFFRGTNHLYAASLEREAGLLDAP